MKQQSIKTLSSFLLVCLTTGLYSSNVYSHGLVESPAARNWYCGAITKPDEVRNGVAEYPECGEAFAFNQDQGYNFMSVLSHDVGRAGVTPLPENVCGFDSESFGFTETVWDQPANWPTSPMSSGRQDFTWNIQWGPHFDDTEEFRFWITKPGFQYNRDSKLGWNDFEEQAFCVEGYDDSNPNGNPDVNPLKATTQFKVSCDVPAREGRHIIYAEWGRTQSTYERFHGCIDVEFAGGSNPTPPPSNPIDANFSISANTVVGDSSITLDGTSSTGNNLSYSWSVNAADNSVYTIDNANAATTTLNLVSPSAAQNVTVTLMVSNVNGGTVSASDTFLHETDVASAWVDLGAVTNSAVDYAAGDQVSVRLVDSAGVDTFYPSPALTLEASNSNANAWPQALAQAVNAATSSIAVGVLNANDQVEPSANATANRIYAQAGSDFVSAFLIYESAPTPPVEPPVEPPVPPFHRSIK